ncbi:5325_t:CDS:2, partial [Racocetra persica]
LPGPLPLPFIENSYLFKRDTKQLFISLQEKYGDIYEVYLVEELGVSEMGITLNNNPKIWKFNRQLFIQAIQSQEFNKESIEWSNKIFQELEEYWNSLANNTNLSNNNLHEFTLNLIH